MLRLPRRVAALARYHWGMRLNRPNLGCVAGVGCISETSVGVRAGCENPEVFYVLASAGAPGGRDPCG